MKSKVSVLQKPRPPRKHSTVRVRIAKLGDRVRTLNVPAGTTVKDLVIAEGLQRFSIRLNRRPVRFATKLKAGDVLAVVPWTISGGRGDGRHAHLSLEELRRRMSPGDFLFFVNFVGADTLGCGENVLASYAHDLV